MTKNVFLVQNKYPNLIQEPYEWFLEDGQLVMKDDDALLATEEEAYLFRKLKGNKISEDISISIEEFAERAKEDFCYQEYFFDEWSTESAWNSEDETRKYMEEQNSKSPGFWRMVRLPVR